MRVTDPYGRAYNYDGEEILIEATLSEQQHRGCYEAVGIPAPPYDPDRAGISIEPANGRDAERLRSYLREQRLQHHSELMVTYDPDTPRAREIDELLVRIDSAPAFPGELENRARELRAEVGAPPVTRVRATVEALYDIFGAERTGGYIEASQRREAYARELIERAEQGALDEDELDEAVHDSCARNASHINNDGRDAQIRHLLANNSTTIASRMIEEAAR
jgi:hypothetical protein